MVVYPNGLGQLLGDPLVTEKPLVMAISPIWVSSLIGNDSNAGFDANKPKATLASAVASLSDHGTIVLMDGHTETITARITVGHVGVQIVGAGKSNGKPTVKLTLDSAEEGMLNIDEVGCLLGNIWFTTAAQQATVPTVLVSGANTHIRDCYFECTKLDYLPVQVTDSSYPFILRDTTFVSTATAVADQPAFGVGLVSDGSSSGPVWLSGVVFDGGETGFGTAALIASDVLISARLEDVSCLRGARIFLVPLTTGYASVTSTSGPGLIYGY